MQFCIFITLRSFMTQLLLAPLGAPLMLHFWWGWIINNLPGWQSLVIPSDPGDGGLPMERGPSVSPKGTLTFHHRGVLNKVPPPDPIHGISSNGVEGWGSSGPLMHHPWEGVSNFIDCFTLKFNISNIPPWPQQQNVIFCAVSVNASPPL